MMLPLISVLVVSIDFFVCLLVVLLCWSACWRAWGVVLDFFGSVGWSCCWVLVLVCVWVGGLQMSALPAIVGLLCSLLSCCYGLRCVGVWCACWCLRVVVLSLRALCVLIVCRFVCWVIWFGLWFGFWFWLLFLCSDGIASAVGSLCCFY